MCDVCVMYVRMCVLMMGSCFHVLMPPSLHPCPVTLLPSSAPPPTAGPRSLHSANSASPAHHTPPQPHLPHTQPSQFQQHWHWTHLPGIARVILSRCVTWHDACTLITTPISKLLACQLSKPVYLHYICAYLRGISMKYIHSYMCACLET